MVDVSPKEMTVDRIQQKIMFVRKADKRRLIVRLIKEQKVKCGIVFTRTKHGANRLVKQLDQSHISAAAIHGNKSQGARTKALAAFKNGSIPILVATDIASRGIDVEGITHVFNYDLPNIPESYVHRIGRTARAGRSGVAYAFCDDSESGYLVGIQNLIGMEIPVETQNPFHFEGAIPKPGQKAGEMKKKKSSQNKKSNEPRPRQHGNRGQKRGNKPQNSNRGQKRKPRDGKPKSNNNRGQNRTNTSDNSSSNSHRNNRNNRPRRSNNSGSNRRQGGPRR
jgi:ATP-dependent RNA helicase RhlE